VIDVHAHVVLEATLGAAGGHGPHLDEGDAQLGRPPCFSVGGYRLEGVAYRNSPFMDVDLRLAAMDRAGIDLQVLSPNPLTYLPRLASADAVAFALRHNDALAAVVHQHPTRLVGLAQLPVQDPAAAIAELRRSVEELGLAGAAIGTDPGRPLDDPTFDGLYSACVDLDVPLFLHPAPDGIDGPRRDDRLARFDGDLWLGFAYEETLAVSTLVLGGVLDRHPALDICVSHGGGATTWLAERMAHAAATRPWSEPRWREPDAVAARLRRLWWDAHVGGPNALAALITTMGTERLVGGTNLAGWDAHHDAAFGDAELAATMDANAARLLRLKA
jgi:aminocarboxymuconate-semialdehyde decarboxylase